MVYTKHKTISKLKHLGSATSYVENALKTVVEKSESSHLDNIFPYIMNDDKTLSKQLVSGYKIIDVYNAEEEFLTTKEIAARQKGTNYELDEETGELVFKRSSLEKNNAVLGHHLIQSFSPEDHLTPEEVHEIGRQTILELTGGEYEFVIATHVDKGHLHNHIIFNSTNLLTGNAFRWQKNTKRTFEKISDKIAEKAGAKIIDKSPRQTHQKYTLWQTENIYKSKIKQRLDHLLQFSSNIEDFKIKAAALNLEVDFSGKWATYKLLDEPQIKNTRGRSLLKSNPEKYNLEQIVEALTANSEQNISVDDVVESYQEKVEFAKNDFDYQLNLEPWQIDQVTNRGIYVRVDFGISQNGQIFVPGFKVDQLENDGASLFIKQKDYFYFMNEKKADKNRYLTGASLVKQMSLYNGTIPIRKEIVISTIDEMMKAINFLADHGVTSGVQVDSATQKLKVAVEEAQDKLNELDSKIIELNQTVKKIIAGDIAENPDQGITADLLGAEIAANQTSRKLLNKKLNQTVNEFEYLNEVVATKTISKAEDEPKLKF